MKKLVGLAVCVLLSAAAWADPPSAALPATPQYTITDLGLEPQWDPVDYQKNAGVMLGGVLLHIGPSGQIAGAVSRYPTGLDPYYQLFTLSHHKATILGCLTHIADGPHQLKYYVSDINSKGQAVVTKVLDHDTVASVDNASNYLYHAKAYLWQNEHLRPLGTIPGSDDAQGHSINENGDILCSSENDISSQEAFVWRAGKCYLLSQLSGYPNLYPSQINQAGSVSASASRMNDSESVKYTVVLYANGESHPLGDPTGHLTATVVALNSQSEILASAINYIPEEGTPPLIEQDFLWTKGKWQALGTKPESQLTHQYGPELSTVTAMNASHQIVGWYGKYKDPDQRAFLFQNGVRQDLDTLILAATGWKLIKACDINDAGQIVGYGKHNGKDRLFLLNPTGKSVP